MDKQINNFIKVLKSALTSQKYELEDPNWAVMAKIASAQSVIPIFNEGVAFYDNVDSAFSQKLFSSAILLLTLQAQRTEEFLYAYEAIVKSGIRALVVKGLVCRHTYGALGDHRPSSDEDIYVKKTDFPQVMEILLGLGYELEDKVEVTNKLLEEAQEISFKSPGGLTIEVHVNLFGTSTGNRRQLNTYFKNAFENAVELDIDGHKVYTLDYTANYLFLFLHLYKHFTHSGVGVRQVMDLGFFFRSFKDKINLSEAEEVIYEMKADKLYADTIEIAKLLGFEISTDLKKKDFELLLMDMAVAGVFGTASEERAQSATVTMAAMDGGMGRTNIIKMLFPSAKLMSTGYPILLRKPWLLPFIWVWRWIRAAFKIVGSYRGSKSFEIGKKRLELMKEYGLIK